MQQANARRHPVLMPPAVNLVHDSSGTDLDDTIRENWQRVDRTAQAMRGFILWDAWAAGYSPTQLSTLLELSSSYVSRLVAYGAIVEEMVTNGEPWDTLPTERACREYLADAREYVSVQEGIPINEICNSSHTMGRVVAHVIDDMAKAATAATLPDTGELLHEPQKHPRERRSEAIEAGKAGRLAIARFNKRLDATIDHVGTWSAWATDAGDVETEMVLGYCKSIQRKLGAVLDELSG